ncbi:amidohydrolase family protein [Oscillospiraceae bacterium OttesenSCG-928-G22]|nr:amidohydrolase family protein [Oscillospiraceae bacterium OttesenSCG-928-G22]
MLDLIIMNGTVITMEGKGVGVIENGAVGIKGNLIEAVGPTDEVLKAHKAHRYIDATRKVVMPGFIDAHMHTGLTAIRGVAQDTNNWMQKGIWPFDSCTDEETDAAGSLLNIVEAVKAGTTTLCDYDSNMDRLVLNHQKVGTRARLAELINAMVPDQSDKKIGALYDHDPAIGNEKFTRNINLFNNWNGKENGRITVMMGPHGPDMMSKELLLEIREFAKKNNTKLHMHVCQGDREILQMEGRYGKRPIPWMDEIGYLDDTLLAVHLTEATREETQLLAKRGAAMILCSGSIGIIDGIVPPAADFIEVSDRLALGSDQAPGNNCNNMFNEMKFTAILNKCKAKDPTVFPAWRVMRMATIDSAKAIGLGDEVGSLKVGKKADIILINLDEPCLSPVIQSPIRNIVPNLVYSAKGSEVEMSIIDGKIVMENRRVLTVNEHEVVMAANEAAATISKRAEKIFDKLETPIARDMKEGYM